MPKWSSWRRWAGWGFLLVVLLVLLGIVIRAPHEHTSIPTYQLATTNWWSGIDPYSYRTLDGFFYLPQAAMLYTPFTWGPSLLGEMLWRTLSFGLFAWALSRMARLLVARDPRADAPGDGKTFLVLSLLAVPSSLGSLRNGQFDLPLAALVLLTATEVAVSRWTAAAFWLCVGLALKPLGLVPLLLFGALYPNLRRGLVIGVAVLVVIPFLHPSPAFVAHEYIRFAETLIWGSKGDDGRYSDLAALLSRLHIFLTPAIKTAASVLGAVGYLGLARAAVQRLSHTRAAWTIGALSADYLMLFNPRAETCSYVFLGPFVAGLVLLSARSRHRRWLPLPLAAAALGLACDAVPRVGRLSIHHLTDRWFKPLIALVFLPVLIDFIFASPPKEGGCDP